jgi:hypothetical protein
MPQPVDDNAPLIQEFNEHAMPPMPVLPLFEDYVPDASVNVTGATAEAMADKTEVEGEDPSASGLANENGNSDLAKGCT